MLKTPAGHQPPPRAPKGVFASLTVLQTTQSTRSIYDVQPINKTGAQALKTPTDAAHHRCPHAHTRRCGGITTKAASRSRTVYPATQSALRDITRIYMASVTHRHFGFNERTPLLMNGISTPRLLTTLVLSTKFSALHKSPSTLLCFITYPQTVAPLRRTNS